MNQVDVVARHAVRQAPRTGALAARMAAWQPERAAVPVSAERPSLPDGPQPSVPVAPSPMGARFALPAEVRAAIAVSAESPATPASVAAWRLPTGPARPRWAPVLADQLAFVPTQRPGPGTGAGVGPATGPARPARRGPRVTVLAWFALATAVLGLAPLGAALGHLTLARVRRTGQAGRDQAIVALVLSYLTMVATVLWFAFAVAPGLLEPLL